MEIKKTTNKTKCDINGCKNLADHTLKVNKMFFSNMHFCNQCLNALYVSIGKTIVPKPIKTPFKTKKVKE
jgi:hypothetical protein